MNLAIRLIAVLTPALLQAQGTPQDYQRAQNLREKLGSLTVNNPGPVTWIGDTSRFWYRKSVSGGGEFVLVDAATLAKKPAFNHEKLAASLSAATGIKYKANTLPFLDVDFVDNEQAVEFVSDSSRWKCKLSDYACTKLGPAPEGGFGGRGGRGPDDDFWGEAYEDMADLYPQQGGGRGVMSPAAPAFRTSPDAKWEAIIENYNVFLRPKGKTEATPLSFDGSEGNAYTLQSIAWSPDSKRLAAYKRLPGYMREVHYVESSPADQLQPKHSTRFYRKPGDTVDVDQPSLFEIATKKQVTIDRSLFSNAYEISRPVWWKDGRAFTFTYNQRGHQVYRLIEVDGATGKARALISEESPTFIYYNPMTATAHGSGKVYRYDVNDGKQIIWASERDGWEHLYLYDGITGRVRNQITKGNWVVRAVDRVDEEKRQIYFQASGMRPGENPYYLHYYRINFEGTGLTPLTQADGDHTVAFSADHKYYVDSWSRVDSPGVAELHNALDQKTLLELERGDVKPLAAAGWHAPEIFSAMGRDGKTDIWGVIFRPTNFDPSKKYPVIEFIYAGPHDSFAPTRFVPVAAPGMQGPQPPVPVFPQQVLAELGFIVVQIDGMGTSNRSKAFHDVAWKNIGDAGFPDRILWHQAVAAKYPWYDISRVGIYGTSAGGQNTLGGLLFHPEFYKVGVANSGCHDNRMDKIWWNEQWMGWPIGPEYAASSNVDNAYRLQGKLLLIVPELDTNVDPSSTMQVVNALIKANKKFDLLFVPGADHGARVGKTGDYVLHLTQDFFVHNLLGIEPPEWKNESSANTTTPPPGE